MADAWGARASAGAGHTAGNDLCTLRDVLTQTAIATIDTEAYRDAWGVRGESLRFFQKPLLITSYWIFNGLTVSCQNGRSSLSSMTAKSSALPAE